MKRFSHILWAVLALALLSGCGASPAAPTAPETPTVQETAATTTPETAAVASADQMAPAQELDTEGLIPVAPSDLASGTYEISVDSSSSMFKITACTLTVEDGQMTAVMRMSGTGYTMVYMGTGEEAAAAPEADCIPFREEPDGVHTFTVPVEALDAPVFCAAFSGKKELWYDRTLIFRSDRLPLEAFTGLTTVESLALADGSYTVAAALSGGSGRASVESPARLRVENGQATATVVFSSPNYDYVRMGQEQYLPVNTQGNSTFELPVAVFDRPVTVYADTTAMSTPHEIEYTLVFDAASIQEAP